MRSRRVLATGLAATVLGAGLLGGAASGTGTGTGTGTGNAPRAASTWSASTARAEHAPATHAPATHAKPATDTASAARDRAAASRCTAFPAARQLPGADGVTPAAWSGGGLVVPACGPAPGGSQRGAPAYPYPGALWTAGYQCVEFSERYLYDRYGITMDVVTNGDQVAAHYATNFPGLFMIIKNGTPRRAPAAGDVLSLSAAPGFDSAPGGHTAVVQSSAVDATGDGTVTVVEENGSAAGVSRLAVTGWTVRYPGFRYVEWLAPTGRPLTGAPPAARHPPRATTGAHWPMYDITCLILV